MPKEVQGTTSHGVYSPWHTPYQSRCILQSRTMQGVRLKWTRDPICWFFCDHQPWESHKACSSLPREPFIISETRYILFFSVVLSRYSKQVWVEWMMYERRALTCVAFEAAVTNHSRTRRLSAVIQILHGGGAGKRHSQHPVM